MCNAICVQMHEMIRVCGLHYTHNSWFMFTLHVEVGQSMQAHILKLHMQFVLAVCAPASDTTDCHNCVEHLYTATL